MNKKILIVEDEFIVAEDLRFIVERAGDVVCGIAASFQEAVELLAIHQPGLVLLDITLQGERTGIDLGRQLKEGDIPFIYISAYSNQGVLEAANATQPYGFLVKPFRERDVLVALDIARYRHENSLESAFRREQILVKALNEINAEMDRPQDKLLKVVLSLQSHVPFDYLLVGICRNREFSGELISYLRSGMKEYQVIGLQELLTMSGTGYEEMKLILQESTEDKETGFYIDHEFIEVCQTNRFKKLLARLFKLEANMFLSIPGIQNEQYIFSFYSRHKNAYNPAQMALLGRLRNELAGLTETISLLFKGKEPGEAVRINDFEGIVGNDPALIDVLDQLAQVAPFDTSVLIQGETGTGKERIAACIHKLSGRSLKPMVKINCAVLPPSLVESELFGHEKGSFTGATEKRIGKFEQADGGTIFLDEIGEMPVDMQAKLLRVLQEKEIERIGGKNPVKIDIRVIAATNRALEKEVSEGRFRMDLFYRLNVFPLFLPPLRERIMDVEQLAFYFAKRFCLKFNRPFYGIDPKMMNSLMQYGWPGNIRELENVIEQAVVMNNGNLPLNLSKPLHLNKPPDRSLPAQNSGYELEPQSLEDVRRINTDTERNYIISIIKKSGGRIRGKGGAAEQLGMPPTTLESRISKLGIKKDDYL
jgi:DNA-binding NtrC family response regulator